LKYRLLLTNVPDANIFRQRIFAEMLLDMEKFTFNANYVLCSVEANQ